MASRYRAMGPSLAPEWRIRVGHECMRRCRNKGLIFTPANGPTTAEWRCERP